MREWGLADTTREDGWTGHGGDRHAL